MFQDNKGKSYKFDSEAAAAQFEQYQKFIQSSEDLNEQFSLMDANITSATDAIQGFAKSQVGSLKFENIEKLSTELDKYTSQRSRLLGVTKADADVIKESLAASYGTLGQYGVSFGQIVKAQNNFINEFNTNSQFTEGQIEKLLLTEKATGVESKKLVHNFREAGMNIEGMNKTMQTTVDYARSIGVATGAVTQKVTDNIGKLNLFNFSEGEKGLAKMAAQSAVLGIDMSKTFQLSENLLDPQKAIDLSASLQRLGVTSSQLLDPLRAMDLAQNDPAELQNQMVELSKQFVKLKEDGSGFEVLPGAKRQLREVAQALGMSGDELSSMALKSAEASRKLQEMRLPDNLGATDEQKQLIANLSNAEGGEYFVNIRREEKDNDGNVIKTFMEKKNVAELKKEDLAALGEQSKPIKLEDLSQKQLDQLTSINNKINADANIKLVAGASSGMISQLTTGINQVLDDTMKEYHKDFGSNKEQIQNLTKKIDELKKTDAAQKIEKGTATIDDIKKYAMDAAALISNSVGKEMLNKLELLTKVTFGETPKAKEVFETIKGGEGATVIGGLVLALTNLTPEIKSLVGAIKSIFKVKDAIIQGESSIISLGSGQVVMTDEKDKIAVGTNLDGKNNTSNLQETLTRKTPTVSEGMVTQQKVVMDLTPLTAVMSEYSKSVKPTSINLAGLDQFKTNQQSVSETKANQSTPIDRLKAMDLAQGTSSKKDIESLLSMVTGNRRKEIELSLFGNKNDTKVEERKQMSPTFNQPSLARLEGPASLPSQKVEFGKLEISLKVDIPNSANVNPDQIKQVLETTMNSTDFKQKLVGAVNEANSNFGQTSVGGTSNYGANKTNYSLNA